MWRRLNLGLPPEKRGMISGLQATVGTLAASLGLAASGFLIDWFGLAGGAVKRTARALC